MVVIVYITTIIIGLLLLRSQVKIVLDKGRDVPFPAIILALMIIALPFIGSLAVLIVSIGRVVMYVESIDKESMARFWKKVFLIS